MLRTRSPWYKWSTACFEVKEWWRTQESRQSNIFFVPFPFIPIACQTDGQVSDEKLGFSNQQVLLTLPGHTVKKEMWAMPKKLHSPCMLSNHLLWRLEALNVIWQAKQLTGYLEDTSWPERWWSLSTPNRMHHNITNPRIQLHKR